MSIAAQLPHSQHVGVRLMSPAVAERAPNAKVLHLIRHAEGTHNVNKEYRLQEHTDAKLTALGEAQCRDLSLRTRNSEVQLIVSSPLTRCLQTATLSYPNALAASTPLVAEENFRETVNFLADSRRSVTELRQNFPAVDFSLIQSDEDPVWARYVAKFGDQQAFTDIRESADLESLACRGRAALSFLASRPEREIAVVSHGAFLLHLFTSELRGISFEYDDEDLYVALSRPWENCELRTFAAEITLLDDDDDECRRE